MNKSYFCRNFFLIDWSHKRLKNTIDLLLFYGEHFHGFSESVLLFLSHSLSLSLSIYLSLKHEFYHKKLFHNSHQTRCYHFFIAEIIVESVNLILMS